MEKIQHNANYDDIAFVIERKSRILHFYMENNKMPVVTPQPMAFANTA